MNTKTSRIQYEHKDIPHTVWIQRHPAYSMNTKTSRIQYEYIHENRHIGVFSPSTQADQTLLGQRTHLWHSWRREQARAAIHSLWPCTHLRICHDWSGKRNVVSSELMLLCMYVCTVSLTLLYQCVCLWICRDWSGKRNVGQFWVDDWYVKINLSVIA